MTRPVDGSCGRRQRIASSATLPPAEDESEDQREIARDQPEKTVQQGISHLLLGLALHRNWLSSGPGSRTSMARAGPSPVQMVQDPVQRGSPENADRYEEDDPGIEGVETGEELSPVTLWRVDRSHPAQ